MDGFTSCCTGGVVGTDADSDSCGSVLSVTGSCFAVVDVDGERISTDMMRPRPISPSGNAMIKASNAC